MIYVYRPPPWTPRGAVGRGLVSGLGRPEHVPAQGRQRHLQPSALQRPVPQRARGHAIRVGLGVDGLHVVVAQQDVPGKAQAARAPDRK